MHDSILDDSEDESMHDLTSWRVTVPRIGARPDPEHPKKQFFVFIIDVRSVDVAEGETIRPSVLVLT